jgi:hypothetical protein
MTDFRDLVDVEGLEPDEEARLRRVHDLLLQAGPPAELPPALTTPGAPPSAEIVPFPVKRRPVALLVAAAAVAAAAFGGGYLAGHSKSSGPAQFASARIVQMRPERGGTALAVLRVASPDASGNWPMEMTVRGLPQQSQRGAYYELWLTRHGRAAAPCGSFRVHGAATTVRLSVPYPLSRFDGWVVTAQAPGGREPGPVVLTT